MGVLEPTSDGGTLVVTEETHTGTVAKYAAGLDDALTKAHRLWLEKLAEQASDNPVS